MSTLILCTYCLSPVQEGVRTCDSCGGSTADDPPVEMVELDYRRAARKPCVSCGVPVISGAVICFACRHRQSQLESEPPDHSPQSSVFFDRSSSCAYLVPAGIELTSGDLPLVGTNGREFSVEPAVVAPFRCDIEVAEALLRDAFSDSMKQAGAAYRRLRCFLAMAEEEAPESVGDAADATFQQLMGCLTNANSPGPDRLLEAIKALSGSEPTPDGVPEQLASLFSSEGQGGLIEDVMGRLRTIAGKLDANVLEKNDHPGGWIDVLHREFFADETARTKERQKNRIRSSVNQSIADGLRRQGFKPSADFENTDNR